MAHLVGLTMRVASPQHLGLPYANQHKAQTGWYAWLPSAPRQRIRPTGRSLAEDVDGVILPDAVVVANAVV
jgi:hypothetical protein